ncbi:MAG: DUF2975 domain-containing protein [Actinomycetia bacterium]|nr:DUF2975 domain-containing protein [Actinomycetes bacterium]
MAWSRDHSVLLSIVATRLIAVLALVLALALPWLVADGFFGHRVSIAAEQAVWLMPIYYVFLVPALVALVALDRLLAAVHQEQVFTRSNVLLLRIISWCCFAAGVVLLASSLVSPVFFALAVLAAFFGVILRAMKNLFAAATALQEESDYTI